MVTIRIVRVLNRYERSFPLDPTSHIESPKRKEVIDPAPNNPWRSRWNNDNQPHNDLTWNVDWETESKVEP